MGVSVFVWSESMILSESTHFSWSCLGMRLADLARTHHDPVATLPSVLTGQYIEAGVSLITRTHARLNSPCHVAYGYYCCLHLPWQRFLFVYKSASRHWPILLWLFSWMSLSR
jgi:hypothetical protein